MQLNLSMDREKIKSMRVKFRNRLLRWYDQHRRDLPWRRTRDPYQIWVSEIMLQQTRVGAVLGHYRRFIEKFPTLETLARAKEQSVLAAWSGLGYYRRARNMHAAAKVIAFELGGNFPETAEALRALPGIGRYTAAAVASIAFGQRTAVVDGNVERVLRRLTGQDDLGPKATWNLAELLISPKRPADFNQAMMELGALVCLPREPNCLVCPVHELCVGRGAGEKAKREVRQASSVHYGFARRSRSVLLKQRPRDISLMSGMWELPEIDADTAHTNVAPLATFKHSILNTDFDVSVHALQGEIAGNWVNKSRLQELALTGLARKILRHFELL
jgi:A/G-specific adenine glycosylase